jgi:phosphatidylinositol glycan class V
MATSPATWFIGSYSEPFYTFFALRGLISLSTHRYFMASVAFAFATLFRANGILLSGFIVWSLVVAPFLRGRSVSYLQNLVQTDPPSAQYLVFLRQNHFQFYTPSS